MGKRRAAAALAVGVGLVAAGLVGLVLIARLLLDRSFGSSVLDPTGGGSPGWLQHVYWYFGHPEAWAGILQLLALFTGSIIALIALMRAKRWGWLIAMVVALSVAAFWLYGWMIDKQSAFASGQGEGWAMYPEQTGRATSMFDTMLDVLGRPMILASLQLALVLAGLFIGVLTTRKHCESAGLVAAFLVSGAVCAGAMLASVALSIASSVSHVLHDTYYQVQNLNFVFGFICGFFAFAAAYGLAANRFGLVTRSWLAWPHWATYTLGVVLTVVLPSLAISTSVPTRYIDYDYQAYVWLDRTVLAGYFATLISVALFAISIGEAILRKIAIRTST